MFQMIDHQRIKEELRVLRMKTKELLSKRAFANFEKRSLHLRSIQLGISPDKRDLDDEEKLEKKLLDQYFDLFQEFFPELKAKWEK
tara:strand:- start:1235 stop:1492 length:258 start_codon:yes stop_codon:yes gene_type:complete